MRLKEACPSQNTYNFVDTREKAEFSERLITVLDPLKPQRSGNRYLLVYPMRPYAWNSLIDAGVSA